MWVQTVDRRSIVDLYEMECIKIGRYGELFSIDAYTSGGVEFGTRYQIANFDTLDEAIEALEMLMEKLNEGEEIEW